MTNVPSLSMPARLVLGRATFQDSTKPDVGVFDVLYRYPHAGLVADGMGVILAEDFPLALTGDKARRLPGLPFGDAVIRALPKNAIAALIERRGQELSEEEIRQLLLPLLRAAASGEVVVAGVPCPPTPDPQYVPFAPNMLPHWRFIPGQDVAAPRIPAATAYMSVRVFTVMEWVLMEAMECRLRAQPRDSADLGTHPNGNPLNTTVSRKGKGGRKPTFETAPFVQEIVRVANGPDGIETRSELNEHMREWAGQHWKDPPSDEWVRQQVLVNCPPEIPPG